MSTKSWIQMRTCTLSRMRFMRAFVAVVTITILSFSVKTSLAESRLQQDVPCPPAQTLPIATGYNYATSSTYAIGNPDPNWTVVADPDPYTSEPRPAWTINKHPAWKPALPGSNWISSYPSYSDNVNGKYIFESCFCLQAGFRTPTLDLALRADDKAEVFLNGHPLGHTPDTSYDEPNPTQLTLSAAELFQVGRNCISVAVENVNQVAMGFNLAGSITTRGLSVGNPQCCNPNGQIMGTKWNDLNGNGIKDPAEPVLPGWTMNLSNGMTAMTDSHGNYYFTNVPPDSYTVTETQQPNWAQTFPVGGGSHTVALGATQVITGLNFGNQRAGCSAIRNPVIKCNPDGSGDHIYSFDVTNLTGGDVSTILLTPPTDSPYTLVPQQFPMSPILTDGQTATPLTAGVSGAIPGEQICPTVTLLDPDLKLCGCSNQACVTVPNCACAQFLREAVTIGADGTTWTFTVENASPSDFYHMYVLNVTPSGASVTPAYFPITLLSGGQTTAAATIQGAVPGFEVCFDVRFYDDKLSQCCTLRHHCIRRAQRSVLRRIVEYFSQYRCVVHGVGAQAVSGMRVSDRQTGSNSAARRGRPRG